MNDKEKAVISQLNKIYSISTNKFAMSSIESERVINTRDLTMHGTNGFAFLLACLVGNKLLPAHEREKIGIPTTTGEAEFCIKNEEELYHDNWQHFVSSIPLDRISSSTLKIISGYARESCNKFKCDYNDVITKFSNMLSRKNLHSLFEEIDKEDLSLIYDKLSNVPVIIIGNGSGNATEDHSIQLITHEHRYELIDIVAVITPDKSGIIPEVISTLEANIISIKPSNFCPLANEYEHIMFKICKLIEEFDDYNIQDIQQKNGFEILVKMYSHDNNGSITDFVKTYGSIKLSDFTRNNHPITKSQYFVNHFADQLPYTFYSSDQTTICDKEFTFCKTDGSCYTEQITIEYSVSPQKAQDLQDNHNEFELLGAHVGIFRASEFMYV